MAEERHVRESFWQRYRFLLTGKWIIWFLITCLFAYVVGFLGQWQWDRHNQRVDQIDKIETAYDAAPLTGIAANDLFRNYVPEDEYTPATLTGHYQIKDAVIIRNRTRAGYPGYETTVPFRTTDGATIIISRGWLPIGNEDHGQPDEIPLPVDTAATGQTTTVTVRAKAGEPVINRDAPAGQLATINLEQYQDLVGYPLALQGYGQLMEETPEAAKMPEPLLRPSTDEGPHQSYSYQWYLFGLLGFIGYFYAARRTAFSYEQDRMEFGQEDTHRHAAWRPEPRKIKRRSDGKLTDEEAEDQLLDGLDH